MGILNCTPDSFSDGGHFVDPGRAIAHGLRMVADGATILDIGGESTRPGAPSVPANEQCNRVLPVIEGLRKLTSLPLSIDTTDATVARSAIEAGVNIINDVSGFTADPAMPALAATTGTGVVLMHMLGTPRTMQANPHYGNCVIEIRDWLEEQIAVLTRAGIAREQIVIDPGIGFGKNIRHNLDILNGLAHFTALGLPVLIGASRKRFIGAIGQATAPCDRLPGSLAALAGAVLNGARILRVHDVQASLQAARVADAIRQPGTWQESETNK